MKTVKQILASKYSDGGIPKGKDTPPTIKDAKMRIKHTSDSVPYNLTEHAFDHMEEGVSQLDKLCEYDPARAKKLAKEALAKLEPLMKQIRRHATHG